MNLLEIAKNEAPELLELCKIDPDHLTRDQILQCREGWMKMFDVPPTAQMVWDMLIDLHQLVLIDEVHKEVHSS